MPNFPYMHNTGKIKDFFQHVQTAGVPTNVNRQYLPSVGFKSSNDRALITLAKRLGFLDTGNVPTQRWRDYRKTAESGAVMAEAIKESYLELFHTYPDAQTIDDRSLSDFFAANTSLGKQANELTVRTFRSVCELADFNGYGPTGITGGDEPGDAQGNNTHQVENSTMKETEFRAIDPSLHINIQIHIDSSASPEQIDQIFSSMARHLYQRDES